MLTGKLAIIYKLTIKSTCIQHKKIHKKKQKTECFSNVNKNKNEFY